MILLLLFVTCLVTVTNLMLVIMKEQRGAGAGGHPEDLGVFLWVFFILRVFEWLRVFSVPFFPQERSLCVWLWVCFYFFFSGGVGLVLKAASCWEGG